MNASRPSKGPLSEINIIPLVDVMLVLLIIFMLTAPMMQQGLPIDLPKVTTKPLPTKEEPQVVTITRNQGDRSERQEAATEGLEGRHPVPLREQAQQRGLPQGRQLGSLRFRRQLHGYHQGGGRGKGEYRYQAPRRTMREENWYKMFVVALLLHVVLLAAFSITFKRAPRKIDLSSYSVNLVGDVGPAPSGGSRAAAPPAPAPVKKAAPVAPEPAKKAPPKEAAKAKPVLQPKENERSITPTKAKPVEEQKPVPPKKENRSLETASRDEVSSLDDKIRQMRSRTQYMDVGGGSKIDTGSRTIGSGGLASSGEGGGSRPLDPAYQKMRIRKCWKRMKQAWRSPGLSKKGLSTALTDRIRKDGRIMDFQIDREVGR